MISQIPDALQRMKIPELTEFIGMSLREAERGLEAIKSHEFELDATYANTHRFPSPTWAVPTFIESANGKGMTYTPYRGDKLVRQAVAQNIQSSFGITTQDNSDVILTPGTQAALFEAISALISPGDTVMVPDPDYLTTERILKYLGANVIRIPMVWEHENNIQGYGQLDFNVLNEALKSRPKLFIFSHPNNPTGTIYSDKTLSTLATLAIENDFVVISDELYCRLVFDGRKFSHIANFPGMKERTITLLGPSKTESLSGYRLGVAVAPSEIIELMEDLQSVTALRAPAYSQLLLAKWLVEDTEFLKDRISDYQIQRDYTVQRLNESGYFEVAPNYGSAYLFPKVLIDIPDYTLVTALKEIAGVVVNPGYQFGIRGLRHVRICFAQDEKLWDRALDRIFKVMATLSAKSV
jgi:aspartate/methionine/tyrosine aminotransferase